MTEDTLRVHTLLEIGTALSAEKNADHLFRIILDAAMKLTNCDGGTLYVLTGEGLVFRIMITKSLGIDRGGEREKITLPPVALSPENVCGRCALEKKVFQIRDVYDSTEFDFSGPRRYDSLTGYRTGSMLVIPMENDHGDVIGVLQLINARDAKGNTVSFAAEDIPAIRSLSSQAAIRLTNLNYSEDLIETLNSFVRVMSTAIDARTPYNANHTRNMVKYGTAFLNWLDKTDSPYKMSAQKKREFLMSVWLHDVGKLVTPLEVMDKESRLGPALNEVEHRYEVMQLLNEVRFLKKELGEEEKVRLDAELGEDLELIRSANRAGFLPDEKLKKIEELGRKTYTDENGETRPRITEEEFNRLSVRKGTLTEEERKVMQDHVVMTAKMLSQMKFTRDYAHVPEWAAAHHEFLNGKGYPNHMSGEEIPVEVRILTILDIFDALTARDRPYKAPMPTEKALSILDSMVRDGQLDGTLFALFKESRAWEDGEENEK